MNTDPGIDKARRSSLERLIAQRTASARKGDGFSREAPEAISTSFSTRLFQCGLVLVAAGLSFSPLIGERLSPVIGSWFESAEILVEAEEDFALRAIPAELAPVLPIDFNERVDKWIQRFLTSHRPQFELYLAREGLYGDMIREKLRSRGMPEDLIYLALVESGFSHRATSSMDAIGVWQFMSPTAVAYGLKVDDYLDERRDPVRATDAALDYLEELHARFGSWYLTAAAYNAGPNRIARVLQTYAGSRTGDEALYWEIIDHLPNETREHVPKMLAAALLAREAQHFDLDVEPHQPYLFDQVLVPGGTPLSALARALEVPAAVMRDLNPHLIGGVTPPGVAYPVRVPLGESNRLVAALPQKSRRAD